MSTKTTNLFKLIIKMFGLKNGVFRDFASLFYPPYCYVCGKILVKNEKLVCTFCSTHLPYTDFYTYSPNPMEKIFWGRVEVEAATALFYFRKGGSVQSLVHKLKYKGRRDIGSYFGKQLGIIISAHTVLSSVDVIVPIPLHPKRERQRGYNQSELIAEGIASVLQKPVSTNVLYRNVSNATQTKKGLLERWENVREIFSLSDASTLCSKHLLLVDDVVTTGSTLEAAANTLLSIPGVKVSMATLAYDWV